MIFREIPLVLFKELHEPDSLRPADLGYIIGQRALMKGYDALLVYQLWDHNPKNAASGIQIFRSQADLEKFKNPILDFRVLMRGSDWEPGKGWFYQAVPTIQINPTFADFNLDQKLLAIARKILKLKRRAIKETFRECEMFPRGNYATYPEAD